MTLRLPPPLQVLKKVVLEKPDLDKMGKLMYSKPELLYMYKGLVGTPPLQMVDDILGIQKCSNKSLQLHSAINTFINLEKLKLSKKKCHNIHIGASYKECPPLKIHGGIMQNSNQEKYLGDILDKRGTCRPNIEKRKSKGYSITSNVLAIVNDIPLGHWKIQAGLSLRQAMLLNGILFNSEMVNNTNCRISDVSICGIAFGWLLQ